MVLCEICKKEFKNLTTLSIHFNKEHPEEDKEQYFIKYIGKENEHLCPVCKGPKKFYGFTKQYRTYCSQKCKGSDPKFKEKIKKTCLEKYGTTTPLTNKKIKEKTIKTNLEKYGVENVSQSEIIKEKIKETHLNKYGSTHVMHVDSIKNQVIEKAKQTKSENFYNKLLYSDRLKKLVTPLFKLEEYKGTIYNHEFLCNKCNKKFISKMVAGRTPNCPDCFPKIDFCSKNEYLLFDFCQELINGEIIQSDRSQITPYELDIYIPSHNLALELNGLYWHSEKSGRRDKNYHIYKTRKCSEKGIRLIHIFEDEWINKQEIVKSIIKNKLKLNKNKIYAKKCIIKDIDIKQSEDFLNNNHIKGFIQSGINIGLFYNNELIALLSVEKSNFNKNYDWEILRFCTILDTTVVDGFSKLLKYFILNNPGSIITYSDLRYSTGKFYLDNGFKFLHTSKPNYFYLKNSFERLSRNEFNKNKLSQILENFDPNLSEWNNMRMNGYDRIWDCGDNVFAYNN